jgi:hypothetical protein
MLGDRAMSMLYHLKKHAHEGVFEPNQVQVLTAAFDEAWKAVQGSGASFASNGHAGATREILALRIIAKARLGETDPIRLRDDALLYWAQTNLKGTGL